MRGYPQFSFWISIAPDMIYLSHIVIVWEKILLINGHRPLTGVFFAWACATAEQAIKMALLKAIIAVILLNLLVVANVLVI